MKRFTGKQRAFINHYIICLNGTEAARLAGYKGDDATLRAIAYENLTKPHIKAEIDRLFAEQVMSRNEVLARLNAQATATMADFIGADNKSLDLNKAAKAGKLHLIKKLDTSKNRIELYDAQSALALLGKHYKLFAEQFEFLLKLPPEFLKLLPELIALFGGAEPAHKAFERLLEKAKADREVAHDALR